MAEKTEKMSNRTDVDGKKVSVTHLVYLSIIFIILTILFWTMTLNTSDEANQMFSFAATITSIVLAVVSIMFSIVSGFKTYTNLGSMRDASEAITDVSHDLGKIKDSLNSDIEHLAQLETEMQNAKSGIVQILQETKAIRQSINPSEQASIPQEDSASKSTFVFAKTSIVGKCIIYACMLSKEKGKHFPAALVGNPSYVHGYITALETCAPSYFRAKGDEKGFIVVTSFDKQFFHDITQDGIQAEVNTNALYVEMNAILEKIHSFFGVA